MKKTYLLLTLLITLIGCSKDDSAPEQQQSKCSQINSFTASQQVDVLNYSITASGNPATYEVVFIDAQNNGMSPDYGNIISLQNSTGKVSLDNYVSQNNSYKVYARVVCSNGEKSDWSTPNVVYINSYCGKPSNLNYGSSLTWSDSNFGNSVSYYQVQYGGQGFTLGNGTIANSNSTSLSNVPLAAQTTYDFYVRSYCNDGKGWSSWTGPYTYFSQYNQNLCSVPTNLAYTLESQNSSYAWIALNWNYNGETNFEYTIVGQGASVSTGNVYTASTGGWPVHQLTKGNNYEFYVRAVCANGNKTNWSTAKLIDL